MLHNIEKIVTIADELQRQDANLSRIEAIRKAKALLNLN